MERFTGLPGPENGHLPLSDAILYGNFKYAEHSGLEKVGRGVEPPATVASTAGANPPVQMSPLRAGRRRGAGLTPPRPIITFSIYLSASNNRRESKR